MNRKEFHTLASQIESHYWLRRVLAYAVPVLIIWVVVALFAYAFLEVFAGYSFGETEVAVIYDANTTDWDVGDVVIHDADKKAEFMLMIVVGKDGERHQTRYLQPYLTAGHHNPKDPRWAKSGKKYRAHYAQIWVNDREQLHAPARFKILIPRMADVDLSHCPELTEEGIAYGEP